MSLPAGDTAPRRLTAGDAAAMQALEAACFSLPWSEEQCPFDVLADPFQIVRLGFMGDPFDVLFDDRSLVKCWRGVVGGCADHFHAALPGALIRISPICACSMCWRNAASSGWANGPAIMRTPAKMP